MTWPSMTQTLMIHPDANHLMTSRCVWPEKHVCEWDIRTSGHWHKSGSNKIIERGRDWLWHQHTQAPASVITARLLASSLPHYRLQFYLIIWITAIWVNLNAIPQVCADRFRYDIVYVMLLCTATEWQLHILWQTTTTASYHCNKHLIYQ